MEIASEEVVEIKPKIPGDFNEFVSGLAEIAPLFFNLLRNNVVCAEFSDSLIILTEKIALPQNFVAQIVEKAEARYGHKWHITLNSDLGDAQNTIEETDQIEYQNLLDQFRNSEDFQKIKQHYPEAEIIKLENN